MQNENSRFLHRKLAVSGIRCADESRKTARPSDLGEPVRKPVRTICGTNEPENAGGEERERVNCFTELVL